MDTESINSDFSIIDFMSSDDQQANVMPQMIPKQDIEDFELTPELLPEVGKSSPDYFDAECFNDTSFIQECNTLCSGIDSSEKCGSLLLTDDENMTSEWDLSQKKQKCGSLLLTDDENMTSEWDLSQKKQKGPKEKQLDIVGTNYLRNKSKKDMLQKQEQSYSYCPSPLDEMESLQQMYDNDYYCDYLGRKQRSNDQSTLLEMHTIKKELDKLKDKLAVTKVIYLKEKSKKEMLQKKNQKLNFDAKHMRYRISVLDSQLVKEKRNLELANRYAKDLKRFYQNATDSSLEENMELRRKLRNLRKKETFLKKLPKRKSDSSDTDASTQMSLARTMSDSSLSDLTAVVEQKMEKIAQSFSQQMCQMQANLEQKLSLSERSDEPRSIESLRSVTKEQRMNLTSSELDRYYEIANRVNYPPRFDMCSSSTKVDSPAPMLSKPSMLDSLSSTLSHCYEQNSFPIPSVPCLTTDLKFRSKNWSFVSRNLPTESNDESTVAESLDEESNDDESSGDESNDDELSGDESDAEEVDETEAADGSSEAEATDVSNQGEITDESDEVEAADESNEVEVADESNEVEAADESNEVEAADESNEAEATDDSNEAETADGSSEAEDAGDSNLDEAADESNEVEANNDLSIASQSEELSCPCPNCDFKCDGNYSVIAEHYTNFHVDKACPMCDYTVAWNEEEQLNCHVQVHLDEIDASKKPVRRGWVFSGLDFD